MDMRALRRTIDWRRQMALAHEDTARKLRPAALRSSCPACDGGEHAPFVEIYGFAYHECGSCGHLFLANPPSSEDIAALYRGATVQSRVYVGEELFQRRVEQIARPKAAFCAEHMTPGGVWFDVGCGTGELLSAVQALGWEPRGCEADAAHVQFARARGLEVLEGYVDAPPSLLAAGVRVLSALNLLEHVPEPKRWLARMTAPLAPGAHVVVEVPRHP